MTDLQKIIKYAAIGLAVLLAVSIIGGIISAVGILGGFMFGDASTEEIKTYSVSADIKSLYIDINAADITVRQGDKFSVESNLKHLTVDCKNGFLSVKEEKKLFQNYNNSSLIITVPTNTVFEKAELKTGAGKLDIDVLSAKALKCDFGAGEICIGSLSASSYAEIDGGAGKITVSGGSINDLDLDMGVGQLSFTSRLSGKCGFDLGIGESDITLVGEKNDYTLDLKKGIGSISIDGYEVSDSSGLGSGTNKVKISGGIGEINVGFTTAQ